MNTIKLTVFIVIVQNAVGLALALGVHTLIKSKYVLRTIFFAPAVLSPVVIAFLWKYMFNPQPDAGLNAMLGFFGLDFLQQNWLGDPSVALWAVGLTVVWQYAGYSMVIFLAALQGIPKDLEEAAALDGAGRCQRFRHIVLPLIAPAMTINLTLSTIGGLKLFDQVFAITGGGPGYSTETLSTLIYKQAFVFGQYGYSTAVALVLALLVSGLALIQMRYLQSREVRSDAPLPPAHVRPRTADARGRPAVPLSRSTCWSSSPSRTRATTPAPGATRTSARRCSTRRSSP